MTYTLWGLTGGLAYALGAFLTLVTMYIVSGDPEDSDDEGTYACITIFWPLAVSCLALLGLSLAFAKAAQHVGHIGYRRLHRAEVQSKELAALEKESAELDKLLTPSSLRARIPPLRYLDSPVMYQSQPCPACQFTFGSSSSSGAQQLLVEHYKVTHA